jgi:hypothetical protein
LGLTGMAVLLAGASDADCDAAFGALDEIREESDQSWRERWQMLEWWPPFLILSATGGARWSGGSSALRGLLYKMLTGEAIQTDSSEVRTLPPEDQEFLNSERDWFGTQGNHCLNLRVLPSDIDAAISNSVAVRLGAVLNKVRPLPA